MQSIKVGPIPLAQLKSARLRDLGTGISLGRDGLQLRTKFNESFYRVPLTGKNAFTSSDIGQDDELAVSLAGASFQVSVGNPMHASGSFQAGLLVITAGGEVGISATLAASTGGWQEFVLSIESGLIVGYQEHRHTQTWFADWEISARFGDGDDFAISSSQGAKKYSLQNV